MSTSNLNGGSGSGATSNCLEFLHCNKCFHPLSMIPIDSPHRPFSLTNCSHIFCGVCRERGSGGSGGSKNGASCCVCSRSSVRTIKLESPMPDYVKRYFHDYIAEWEVHQLMIEERRKVHASALKGVAKTLEDIVRELSTFSFKNSGSNAESVSFKTIAQTAKFQQDQWKSLAKGYTELWSKFRKSREETRKYQNELQNVQKALREAEEVKRKMEQKLREVMQQQQQKSQLHRREHPKDHRTNRPMTSTPAPFISASAGGGGGSVGGRSPFFRKISAPDQNRASLSDYINSSGGRRRSGGPLDADPPPRDRRSSGDGGCDGGGGVFPERMNFQTPKIFSTGRENGVGDEFMTSPYF